MNDWFYPHKEHGLCLTFKAMVDCGVNENTLWRASSRDSRAWGMIDHPEDRRKRLIVWRKLRDCYKEKVVNVIGDPVEYMAIQPIRDLVEMDFKAEDYYRKKLVEMKVAGLNEYVVKYTTAASWLNMLVKVHQDKKMIKKQLNMSVDDFMTNVRKIIETDKIDLPGSYSRLLLKLKEYQLKGYDSLIDWRFGNKLSAKIGKSDIGFDPELAQKQVALIRRAASMHNNFDAGQIAGFVNQIFEKNGWETVSHGTVYNVVKANEHLTTAGARGKRVYSDTIAMQVKRRRPEFPLMYWTLDGWTVELLYQDANGKPRRMVVVIVLDAMNNYPVGYAIGNDENAELIRMANRNAIVHINDLFGQPYRPWQIQSDNFAIKQNTPFFQAIAHLHTPAAVGNAKSKVIEPYFAYLNKKYCQTQYNWGSFNVTASKKNQFNREFSDKIKNQFPTKEGVIAQIEAIIMAERNLKADHYRQQFSIMSPDDKVILGREDWLMIFGKPTGYTNSITGVGLTPTIAGKQLVFDSFDPAFRALQHLSWKVIYDECDLSSVLAVSEDDRTRFVLQQKRVLPMDVRSMTTDDHAYLSDIKAFNKTRAEEVIQTYIKDAAVVNEVLDNSLYLNSEAELALKGMFIYNGQQKEALQEAKGLKQLQHKQAKVEAKEQQQDSDNWQQMQYDYLQSKTDFNQYLD